MSTDFFFFVCTDSEVELSLKITRGVKGGSLSEVNVTLWLKVTDVQVENTLEKAQQWPRVRAGVYLAWSEDEGERLLKGM